MIVERTVLITGAASGIGLATAKLLLAEGWQVIAGVHPNDDTSRLPDDPRLMTLPFDITDQAQVDQAFQQIQARHGQLHGLINNAGIVTVGPLESAPMAQIQAQFEVNVFGHLRVTRAALPLLRAAGGARIINVSSLMGRVALPALGAYSMSKHALEALSDGLRLELQGQNIAVISILPGVIGTAMTDAMADRMRQAMQDTPEGQQRLYSRLVGAMTGALERFSTSATPVDAVTQAISKALVTRKPEARYIVGNDARGLLMMRRFAPDHIADGIIRRALGLHK